MGGYHACLSSFVASTVYSLCGNGGFVISEYFAQVVGLFFRLLQVGCNCPVMLSPHDSWRRHGAGLGLPPGTRRRLWPTSRCMADQIASVATPPGRSTDISLRVAGDEKIPQQRVHNPNRFRCPVCEMGLGQRRVA